MTMRWREKGGEREIIHADGPFGNGCTLCGYAQEGEDGSEPLERVTRRRITCDRCITVIGFCKSIRNREISR